MKPALLAERRDFRLGNALIRPSVRTVEGPSRSVTAEPRVMQVLLTIADAGGAVVSREELTRCCWDGRIVGEDSLNRAIAEARRLARTTGSSFGIETIPRIGYRLVGATADAPHPASGGEAGVSRRLLVGGAAAVLVSTVAGLGLWSWRRGPSDGFDAAVERGFGALLYGSPQSLDRAAMLLERAVAIRPSDARVWGLLACARQSLAEYSPPGRTAAAVASAADAAKRALALQPDEPNASVALIELQGGMLSWAVKEDRLRQVLTRDQENFVALQSLVALLQASGRDRLSWDLNERAVGAYPLAPAPQYRRGLKHWIFGRVAEADRAIGRAMELWPRHPSVWNARFLILALTGRPEGARAMIEDRERRPEAFKPLAISTWGAALDALQTRTPQALAAAREAIFKAARVSPGLAAHGVMMLSALGDADAAFAVADGVLLSRGPVIYIPPAGSKRELTDNPTWRYTQWLFTPPCAIMRADRRFGPLCDGLGLTAYWRKRGVRPDYVLRGQSQHVEL